MEKGDPSVEKQHVAEYNAFRSELQNIITIRYSVFIGLTSLYALLFALIGTAVASQLLSVFPLLLLAITFPVLLINHYLTVHYRRLDGFLAALEESFLPDFVFYKKYTLFRKIEKERNATRWPNALRKYQTQSVYTVPILYAYLSLVLLGAIVSAILGQSENQGVLALELVAYVLASTAVIAVTYGLRQLARRGDKGEDFKGIWRTVLESEATRSRPSVLILLDRDGVLCVNLPSGVLRFEDFMLVDNVHEALVLLNIPPFEISVITNQPYLHEGTLTLEELKLMNEKLLKAAKRAGLSSKSFNENSIHVCPHQEEERCDCRKPKTGLLEDSLQDHCKGGAKTRAYVVGDQWTDIKAGEDLAKSQDMTEIRTVLVDWKSGDRSLDHVERCKSEGLKPSYVARSLLDAAYWIRTQEEHEIR